MNNSLHDVDLFSEEISSEDLHAEVLPDTSSAASCFGSMSTFGTASGGSKGTSSTFGTRSG